MKKSAAILSVVWLALIGATHAQEITDSQPEATEKSDGMPGEALDRDNDGIAEGRSIDGPAGTEIVIEGKSESPSREKPEGETGATVSVKKDF